MTNGGPKGATQTALYYATNRDFGLGASRLGRRADAMAVILFLISVAGHPGAVGDRRWRDAGTSGRLMRIALPTRVVVYMLVALAVLMRRVPAAVDVLLARQDAAAKIIDPNAPLHPDALGMVEHQ